MSPASDPVGHVLGSPLVDRDDWSAINCTVARAMDVVGTRSAVLLMREAYYGTRRFDDFARRVGISQPVAAARLRELVDAGLLVRQPYQEPGSRSRMEYRLTTKGRDLLPAVIALMQWGDAYACGPAGPPIELRHRDCGGPVRVEVRCSEGHSLVARDIVLFAGPGVSWSRDR